VGSKGRTDERQKNECRKESRRKEGRKEGTVREKAKGGWEEETID
jgi:hypothetical protein